MASPRKKLSSIRPSPLKTTLVTTSEATKRKATALIEDLHDRHPQKSRIIPKRSSR